MLITNNIFNELCPFCSSTEVVNVGEIKYPENLLFSTTKIKLTMTPVLYRCECCKSGFTNNIIDEKSAMKIYEESDSSFRWNQGKELTEIKPSKIINFLKRNIKKDSNVLDIGANKGELLDFIKNEIGSHTFANELSEASQKKLKEKGHFVYSSLDIIADESIDIICLFDVIEHIYDLKGFLSSLHRLLSKNGKIIILTGNINSFSALAAKNNWWYLNAPEHIRFPSIQVFKNLNDYKYSKHLLTYNANGYKSSVWDKIKVFLKITLFRKNYKYNGIPLLTDDHFIIILDKK